MPIPLGVLAVAGAGAGPVAAGNAYEWLATQIMTNDNTSSVNFSNLNSTYGSTYQHLQIRAVHRNTANDTAIWLGLRFNSATGTVYARHDLVGGGSTPTSSGLADAEYIILGESVSSQIITSSFASNITDILDAFETTKYTTIRSLSGQTGSRNRIWLNSGLWKNTAAVDNIELYLPQGGNFITGSRFSLYGLRSV